MTRHLHVPKAHETWCYQSTYNIVTYKIIYVLLMILNYRLSIIQNFISLNGVSFIRTLKVISFVNNELFGHIIQYRSKQYINKDKISYIRKSSSQT